jgi:kumamolisin
MRRIGPFLLAVTLIASAATTLTAQSTHTRHVREAVRNGEAQQNGHVPATQVLNLDLVLPLRDQAGLDAFLADVYNPQSANYRHFLTPAQFTQRFGPSEADYDAVVNFAESNGLTVTGGSRDTMDVQVSGQAAAIESAFRIRLNTYKHPTENRTFYGPDREPTTSLPFDLWHISGLDNYSIPHPLVVNRHEYAAAHNLSAEGVVSHATTGSGPSASFLGSDMRAAYYGSGSLTGAGQTVGLLEYYGTDLDDLNTYYTNAKQTNTVPVVLVSVDGTSTSCLKSKGCDDTEQELDITQALGMAPGLQQLTMYVGSSDTAIIGAMTVATDQAPLPLTIGCSWGWTPVDPNSLDPYFQKMASQGQTFFAASGDSSTWSFRVQAWPADDPYVVSVGGTDLITASAGGPWQSETAWADSGGGITKNGFAIPSWQALPGVITSANKGSTSLRNGPDVSANANFTFYTCSNQTSCLANTYGGTSFAAPMWAGYVALANQQVAASKQWVGFLNPTIYQQNINGSTFAADFHDITSGTSGSYSAVTGYDLVTGWGSPNAGLIAALTGGTQSSPDFSLSASPSSVSAQVSSTQGAAPISTISTAVSGGFSSDVTLSASGSSPASGITVQFGTNPIVGGAGSSVATFTVPAGTAAGTYNFTITATGGHVTHTTSVSVTVSSSTPAADFALTATAPAPSSIRRSGTTTSTVTVAGVNGFSSNVSLSASAGGGLSASFNPASIGSGAGNSTITITASKNAGFGNHTITITGTGGGVTHTTTVNVTVTK